jgi:multidrug efflux system membrane fusion protein
LSKRAFILVSGLVLFASITGAGCSGSAAGTGGGGGGRGGRGRGDGGAVPVVTAKVTERDVPVDLAAIGNVEAYTTISVRSQVTGQLQEVSFHEGDFVKKGQQLFTVDRRPFEAALQQAQANLVRDQALLSQAEAQLARDGAQAEYAQLTSERQADLLKKGIVSKDVSEQARASAEAQAAAVKADRAAVESAQAQLVAQQAAIDTAKVQLEYCVITSPIDGRTGNISVKNGNLVTANTTELMTIAQVEPIFVTFSVPAIELNAVKQGFGGKDKIPVTVTPQDGSNTPVQGDLAFIDNAVDASTDTIKLKGRFTNNDHRLWPGQFARVSVRVTTLPHAMILPNQAVQTGQDGQFVFLVKGDAVDQQPVTTGQRVGEDVVIEKGLQVGQTVVTEGQLRLEAGTKIQTGGGAAGRGNARSGRGQGQQQGQGQGQGRGRPAAGG